MKYKTVFLSLMTLSILIYSCKKEDNQNQVFGGYANYSVLKVGNSWIYQIYDVDSSGNFTPRNEYDSCYVEKDTIINTKTYYKVVKPNMHYNEPFIYYLRDSLHCIVNSSGKILLSSWEFQRNILEYDEITPSNDTIYHVSRKMGDQDFIVITTAGNFSSINAKETYTINPKFTYPGGLIRYRNVRYSPNIGIVTETLPFYLSNPNYYERRLVRYHLN